MPWCLVVERFVRRDCVLFLEPFEHAGDVEQYLPGRTTNANFFSAFMYTFTTDSPAIVFTPPIAASALLKNVATIALEQGNPSVPFFCFCTATGFCMANKTETLPRVQVGTRLSPCPPCVKEWLLHGRRIL